MYLRIVSHSLRRRAKAKLAALAAVALGAGAASGLVLVFLQVGDRIQGEMRKHEANLEIRAPGEESRPAGQRLFGDCFWKNQVVGVTEEVRVESDGPAVIGREPDPAWRIEGSPGVLAGVSLGLRPGETIDLGRPLVVTGTVETGGEEDGQIVVPAAVARELPGRRTRRYLVSALVTPETEAYRLFRRLSEDSSAKDAVRRSFTEKEIERFNCTPFPVNVARDLAAAVGGEGRVIRRVAESEGALLRRIETVVWVLAAGAVAAACLSVFAAMTAGIVDRRKEIGLLKALGATNGSVASIFLGEAFVVAVAGSALGYGIGVAAAKGISTSLFGAGVPGSGAVYLVTLAAAIAIVGLGVALPLRSVVRLEPTRVLHEV
jgi:putative ABC transport system permease protein